MVLLLHHYFLPSLRLGNFYPPGPSSSKERSRLWGRSCGIYAVFWCWRGRWGLLRPKVSRDEIQGCA